MDDYNFSGRISRRVFTATTLTFLIVCLICSVARFYIRIRVQKEVGWDDAFFLFGLLCLIVSTVLIFMIVDTMYVTEGLLFNKTITAPSIDILLHHSVFYRKLVTVGLIMIWFSICSVKASFLALFRRLIDRMPSLIKFWYFAVAINVAVTGYGAAVYVLSCPDFYSLQMVQCVAGPGLTLALRYSISQMALDIIGDLLILIIPVRLIWKIRIRWVRKVALSFCLCLTIIMIIITVIRASGIKYEEKLDLVWETYWNMIAGEVGLILTSITAFRTIFVARANDECRQTNGSSWTWGSLRRLVGRLFVKSTGSESLTAGERKFGSGRGLSGNFPRATMTGLRTFIKGHGQTGVKGAETLPSVALTEENEDMWPFPERAVDLSANNSHFRGRELHVGDE